MVFLVLGIFTFSAATAAKPPKELQNIINDFMSMESTSMEVLQVIDWKYKSEDDSVRFQMNILANQNFHLDLWAFGLEIFITETEMLTVNHVKKQVIYENASPDALLDQLFVGGDLADARFKDEKKLKGGDRELEFLFSSDFSDWESLSVTVDDAGDLQKIKLVDYDGNHYHITFKYLNRFSKFVLPDISKDLMGYKIADMRK